MVESVHETTDGIEPGERWTFWKDTAMAAVDGVHLGDSSTFSARRTVTSLASGVLIDTVSSPLSARRPAQKIAQDGDDGVCLMLLVEGRALIDQTSLGESALPTGSGMLFDLTHPYAVAVPFAYRETRLYVPRNIFAARVGPIERLVGQQTSPDTPLVILFNSYLAAVSTALPTMSQQEADAGLDGVLHLLSGLFTSRSDLKRDEGEKLSTNSLLALADRHIAGLLSNSTFDGVTLARILGVSRASLYRAYAERGGVATAIRDARLDRARQRFVSPADQHRTLAEIAFACGFTDYPPFSRSFRQRFGMSPKDARGL